MTFGREYADFTMECQRRMRLNGQMDCIGLMGWVLGLAGCAWAQAGWVEVPPHETRHGRAGGFEMGRLEVTVREFAAYLDAAGVEQFPETAQISGRRGGGYAVRRGRGQEAVAEVTATEAEAYAGWLAQREGRVIRLPTEAEWEVAARGGVEGAPYPWGWGGNRSTRAQFDAAEPLRRGGRFAANGFGLHDMAGNLYEWCAADAGLPPSQRAARGGAWSERDPERLRVDHRALFPAEYRGRDVGFRLLRERVGGK